MFLRNNSKRLIIINHGVPDKDANGEPITVSKPYNVPPGGETVEVPDEACDCDFVQTLLQTRDLVDVTPLDDVRPKRGRPAKEQTE